MYLRRDLIVRLACMKHAASVRPEPGSNSPLSESLCPLCYSPFRSCGVSLRKLLRRYIMFRVLPALLIAGLLRHFTSAFACSTSFLNTYVFVFESFFTKLTSFVSSFAILFSMSRLTLRRFARYRGW